MTIPKPLIFALSSLVIVAGAILLLRLPYFSPQTVDQPQIMESEPLSKKEPGFHDVVKDLELWNEMIAKQQRDFESTEETKSWSDDEIDAAIREYVFSSKKSGELRGAKRELQMLGSKTHSTLLAILTDPDLQDSLIKLQEDDFLQTAPIVRLCELFNGSLPNEAVELLLPYTEHHENLIRRGCALALAETGSASALSVVQQALSDDDEFVRSSALIGLNRALDSDSLADELIIGVLSDLEELIRRGDDIGQAARLLVKLDESRAQDFLVTSEFLDPERKSTYDILRVVREMDLEIEHEQVRQLIEIYSNREMDYPNDYALGEALALLGEFQVAEDEALLEKQMEHPNKLVAEGAAKGLIAFHDLEKFQDTIWSKATSNDWDTLTKEQKIYFAVTMLDAEVRNGGHAQYFFNSWASDWEFALEGLKSMGLEKRVALFERVLKLFGESGPSKQRDERQRQLSEIFKKHESEFKRFDSEYYKLNEHVEVAALRYVLQHPHRFR